jgi:hypothetical protein
MLFTLCSGAFALFLRRANHASLGPAVLLCLVFIQALEGPIQAQRVLIVAPEDTVSGSERPGMVMIDVALRKQPRATATGRILML